MASYATASGATPTTPGPARLYWRITGPVLALVAALGLLLNALGLGGLLGGFLSFDWAHNVVHLALAGLAFWLGYGAVRPALAAALAKVVGGTYLLLGVVGFVSAGVFGAGDLLGLHLEVGENLIHLALGGWGLYAGFAD